MPDLELEKDLYGVTPYVFLVFIVGFRFSNILLGDRGNLPSEIHEFSLKDYAEKALWLHEHVRRLLAVAEPRNPSSRLGGFLNIPLHVFAISPSSLKSSRDIDISIPTLAPLLNRELDPSADPFTAEQLRHRRDESCPSMSGVDSVVVSGHHLHPEVTMLSYLHKQSYDAYPFIGLSRPSCYACFRLFDAYNAKANPRTGMPYNLYGPDPELHLPWAIPLDLATDMCSADTGSDSSIKLRGAMWEQFARTLRQDVRDLWMRAVSFQRVSHKSAELRGKSIPFSFFLRRDSSSCHRTSE